MSREWDWQIESFEDGVWQITTTHFGIVSFSMELDAIRRLGRKAKVTELTDYARKRAGWKQTYKAILI